MSPLWERDRGSTLRNLLLIACLIWLGPWHGLWAQVFSSDEAYGFEVWKREQGLPQITVTALSQDSHGYLWVGTEEGLARFDGLQFTVFDRENTPELGSNAIRALFLDRQGYLWIGSRRGLSRYRDGIFDRFRAADGLADDEIHTLHGDIDGVLWIGTAQGVSRFEGDGLTSLDRGFLGRPVRAIHRDRQGSLWVGTDFGLARLTGDKVEAFTTRDGLPHDQIRALHLDRRGRLWIATAAGLIRYTEDRFETLDERLSSILVVAFWEDREGRLWFGTQLGLFRVEGDSLVDYSGLEVNRTGNRVQALWEDHEGNLWIGTGAHGLASLRRRSVSVVDRDAGLVDDLVWSMIEDRDGGVWVSSNKGLTHFATDGRIRSYTPETGMPGEDVRALWQGRGGELWAGTDTNGLARIQDHELRVVQAQDPMSGNGVTALLEDRHGVLWVGSRQGLQRVGAGDPLLNTGHGLPHEHIWTLHEGPRGGLWVGTAAGLAHSPNAGSLDPGFTPVAEHVLGRDVIKALHHDAQGALWVGTSDSGLIRLTLDGTEVLKVTRYGVEDGLLDSLIHHILEDDLGWLWMSSNRGVFRIRKKQLEEHAAGRLSRLRSLPFTESDGMGSRECNGLGHPAGMVARDGRLWFPTIKGAAVFDPGRLSTSTLPVPIHVHRVVVDQQPFEEPAGGPVTEIELDPGAREIQLHYRAMSLLDAEKIRYRYQLQGYDHDWVEAGTTRSARYMNLPPGEYRFRVRATNVNGTWESDSEDTLDLQLSPAFHQTRMFYLLMILTVVLAGRGIHRLRVQRLLHRDRLKMVEAKNQEIEQFTYNVCHDLKSPLVTIQGFVSLLEEDLADDDRAEIKQGLRRIHGATVQMSDLLNELLAYSETGRVTLQAQPLKLTDLAREASELVAGQLAEGGVTMSIAGDLPTVLGDKTYLLRVFQNLIDNGVKFMGEQAQPRIAIGAHSADGEVVCRVEDNGSGVAPEDRRHIFELFSRARSDTRGSGIGLALVSRIVTAHGGRIWVESEGVGRGSAFCFTLPLAPQSTPAAPGSSAESEPPAE